MLIPLPRFILCLILGALMTLAYAPFNIFILGLICPALLIISLDKTTPSQAFLNAYCFGLGLFGTGVYWLHISINMFGGVTLVGSILVTAALVAFISLYPALVGFIARRWFSRNQAICIILIIPALWVLAEWARSWVFTGFPWLNLAYSQSDTFLANLVPIVGAYGLSWLTMLLAALLASLYYNRGRSSLPILVGITLICVTCLSLGEVDWTRQKQKQLSTALVQAAIPQELKWLPEMREKSLELYMQLSAPHWGADLIVWPETAIPAYPESVPGFINNMEKLTRERQTLFLSGLPSRDQDSGNYYNSVMMLGEAEPQWYHKQHLVPFGEYLPLKPLLGRVLDFLQIPMSDFSKGKQEKPLLMAKDLAIGISICYEDTFGEEVIGALPEADILVNVSNDAWFGDSLAPHQHLQMARMRALESGRYLLRATNTGITAIIDEKGRILERSTQFKAEALSATVKLFQGATPYVLWGNLPVIFGSLLVLLVTAWFFRRANT